MSHHRKGPRSSLVYSFTQTNISTYNQLIERLNDLGEGYSRSSPSSCKGSFSQVKQGRVVVECVVSEDYVAYLLREGCVCRVRYREEQPGTSSEAKEKSDDDAASTSSARSRGSRSASPRPEGGEERGPSGSLGHSWSTLLGSTGGSATSAGAGVSRLASRGRIQLLRRRGSGRGLIARWPIIPAAEVPERLIDQAMGVLQGKSRESVIRELQRTGLDVNQAVNNLLSRDDDEGEQEETIAAFLPSGEELLSLLGGVGDDELEEVLGRVRDEAGAGRESRAAHYDVGDPLQSEIRSLVSLASGRLGGPSGDRGRRKMAGRKEASGSVPVLFEDCVEWWEPMEPDCRFVAIASLYSQLLAVDNRGRLHCWSWQSATPSPSLGRDLEQELGLAGERVRLIAARLLRASVVTESGKVATWLDRSVHAVSGRLEHKAQSFSELAGETVSQLHVCELFSVVSTESGKLFWWGMLPFADRKEAILQAHEKVRLAKYGSLSGGKAADAVLQGSKVCLRSSPIYCVGTRAIHIHGGKIQCGVLQESVFSTSLLEKCRFRVIVGEEEGEMEVEREGEAPTKLGIKRRHSGDGDGPSSEGGGKEEFWSLRNVIFTDSLQTLNTGSVVKVDGTYAAVHFPALEPGEMGDASLSNCRLLRKDDLILASEAQAHQTPYFSQESLKRLKLPASYYPQALACDQRGVYVLLSANSLLRYVQFSMTTGRFVQNAQFTEATSRFFLKRSAPVQLLPMGVALWLVRDADGGLYPFTRDHAGAMRDPPFMIVPPVTSVCVGPRSCDSQVCVVCVPRQSVLPAVARCDLPAIRSTLEDSQELTAVLREHCAGGCNLLHILAWLGRPQEPFPGDGGKGVAARTTPRARLRELMKHARAMATGAPSFDPFMWGGEEEEEEEAAKGTSEGPGEAMRCVEWLCGFTASHSVLADLLKERSIEGYTPFMAATAYKAYGVAQRLFELAKTVSNGEESLLSMLYPPDSHQDDNPVFVVCRNDACSFTWTGEEHIQQDIFECRTCSLTGSLCCCTECAYTCHRGHDCSFKRSSPTAYCDCWEKCKCRSLSATSDNQRLSLLLKLLKETSLSLKVNSRQEHLLGMLVGTLARQTQEQGQWQSLRSTSSYRQRSSKHDDAPPHDLPPPKFAQKALNLVLEEWRCVKAALTAGDEADRDQPSTVSLDALTHTLLAKLNKEVLDSLLTRLVRQVGPSRRDEEAVAVSESFLRSVVRVFTTCQIEALNVPQSSVSTSRRRSVTSNKVAEHAARALSSLAPLAVRPLVRMARALVYPVTVGVVRPVDLLCMTDRHKTADELFKLPPPSLFRIPPTEEGHPDDGGSDTESEGEDVGPAHDASSTATIGSNPIYLSSDQDSSDGEEVESGENEGSLDGESRHDDDLLMDHTPSHRVTVATSSAHWALPSAHTTPRPSSSRLSRASAHSTRDLYREYPSMGMSACLLAQTFSLLVRQLVDVLSALTSHLQPPTPPYVLPTLDREPESLQQHVWEELHRVWAWLFAQMDVVECQVRLGNALEGRVKPQGHTDAPSDLLESRKDFLAYILSLLRTNYGEHGGVLPSLDVSALEHLAWTLDALYFLLKNTDSDLTDSNQEDLTQPDIAKFFRRSNSTTYLGALPLSPFAPLSEALPLAERPHLLDQEHPRPELFGYEHPTLLEVWPVCPLPDPPIADLVKAPLTGPWRHSDVSQVPQLSADHVCGIGSCELAAEVVVGRWANTVRLFSRAFADTVGRVPVSYLTEERIFESLEREFRREMDSIRTSSSHREVIIAVERGKVLAAVIGQLNLFCEGRQMCTSSLPPLCVYRVKASFIGEPGEGSGVLRSLFTSFAEAVLSDDPLPRFESRKPPSPGVGVGSKVRLKEKLRAAKSGNQQVSKRDSMERFGGDEPLFYQPGKPGFYAPRYAPATPERMNAYRNVGRMIGLCLLNCETIPLPLCRHVLKYILNKPVSWHDLAFFDPVMYESLRQLTVDARLPGGRGTLADQHLVFQVTLGEEEGGGIRELVPGGATKPVTPDNVCQYVRLYGNLRMLDISKVALQHLHDGVYDVLPQHSLGVLSAESLRLLLCGCPQIDVDALRGITIFDDESRKSPEALCRFKSWFWSVLERMSQHERQDLLYFWTSSPLLPANVESYQPPPSITIRPPDDQRLPTANTCISRLYVPLYSSKAVLKLRLLTAIKTKTFGFV